MRKGSCSAPFGSLRAGSRTRSRAVPGLLCTKFRRSMRGSPEMRRSFVGSPARAQDSASSRMIMVRGARARTLAPTSSGTGSRGQEGSAPHVRAGLSTADCSRLKALGMTMIKGSRSAPFGFPFAWLRASAKAGQAQGLEVVPFPECSRARAPAPRNTSAPHEVCAPINTSRLSKSGLRYALVTA